MGLEKEGNTFTCNNEFEAYVDNVEKHPLLTKEEEYDLFYRYKNGDLCLKDIIVKANLKLVLKEARKYVNLGLSFEDLVQEGNIGLLKAIELFDIKRGNKFSTYAVPWINQTIKRALDDKGKSIRIPVHISLKINSYKKAKDKLTNSLNQEPTFEMIADYLNISVESVKEYENYLSNVCLISLNQCVNNEEDSSDLENFIATNEYNPEDMFADSELKEYLQTKISELTEKEQYVIIHRFGLNNNKVKTLAQIGEKFGYSRERVRQIEQHALNKLKLAKNIDQFSVYMDRPEDAQRNIKEFRKQYYLKFKRICKDNKKTNS